MAPQKRSVLLIDDHPVAVAGLRLMLAEHATLRIAGEAADVATARRLAEELQPDFIVADLRLGGRDGIELIEDLHAVQPAAQILVFSNLEERHYAPRALRAGARGFVTKTAGLPDVLTALAALGRGEYAFSATVQRALVEIAAGGPSHDPLAALSDRELQIFRLLGEDRTTAEIAAELHVSIKTVGSYRERLKEKLNLRDARALEKSAREFVRQEPGVSGGKRKW